MSDSNFHLVKHTAGCACSVCSHLLFRRQTELNVTLSAVFSETQFKAASSHQPVSLIIFRSRTRVIACGMLAVRKAVVSETVKSEQLQDEVCKWRAGAVTSQKHGLCPPSRSHNCRRAQLQRACVRPSHMNRVKGGGGGEKKIFCYLTLY
jgi:hypothetical protein